MAGAGSCSGQLASLPICAGGGSKSDKNISLTEMKCPVLGARHLAQISKSEKMLLPQTPPRSNPEREEGEVVLYYGSFSFRLALLEGDK